MAVTTDGHEFLGKLWELVTDRSRHAEVHVTKADTSELNGTETTNKLKPQAKIYPKESGKANGEITMKPEEQIQDTISHLQGGQPITGKQL